MVLSPALLTLEGSRLSLDRRDIATSGAALSRGLPEGRSPSEEGHTRAQLSIRSSERCPAVAAGGAGRQRTLDYAASQGAVAADVTASGRPATPAGAAPAPGGRWGTPAV